MNYNNSSNPDNIYFKQKTHLTNNSVSPRNKKASLLANKKYPKVKLNESLFREKLKDGSLLSYMSSKNNKSDKKYSIHNKLQSNATQNDNNNYLTTNDNNTILSSNHNTSINNNNNTFLQTMTNFARPKTNFGKSLFDNSSSNFFNKTFSNLNNNNYKNSNNTSIYTTNSSLLNKTKSTNYNTTLNKTLMNSDLKETTCSDISVLPYLQEKSLNVEKKFNKLNEIYLELKHDPELLEQDLESLKDMYFTYKNTEVDFKMYDKEKELFEKYCIDVSTIPIQENIIKNFFKKEKEKNKLNSNDDNNKDKNFSYNTYYENINNAVKSINTNKQIHDSISGIWSQKQIEKYYEVIEKEEELRQKLALMPIIRESKFEKTDKRRRLEPFGSSKENENLDFKKINDDKKGSSKDFSKMFLSRDIILTKELVFKISNIDYKKNRPTARSHSCFVNMNGVLYMFGGVNGDRFNDVWTFEASDDSYKWTKIETKRVERPLSRCSHTMVKSGHEIFIYGGSIMDFERPHEDIVVFNTLNNKFFVPGRTFNRTEVKFRKAHVAFAVKNLMIIHGGIDESEQFLSDTWLLNLSSLKWESLDQKGSPLGALAYHSCCVVINFDKFNHKNFELYKSNDVPTTRSLYNKIKIEGIYFFGGIDQYNNNYSDIKILRIGRKPCEWVTPKIEGRPPKPRNSASVVFYEDMNLLIVYGGKNVSGVFSEFYKDIHVLDLEKMIWFNAKVESQFGDRIKRSNHCGGIIKNKMIIFGGIDDFSYCGSDTFMVNCDLIGRYEEKQAEKKLHMMNYKDEFYKKQAVNSKNK